jgi:hypothetical protein
VPLQVAAGQGPPPFLEFYCHAVRARIVTQSGHVLSRYSHELAAVKREESCSKANFARQEWPLGHCAGTFGTAG